MEAPALTKGEVIRIAVNDTPAYYGRVDRVAPGEPGWWRLDFLALTLPAQPVAWIISTEQVAGAPFIMNGMLHRVEKIAWMVLPDEKSKKAHVLEPIPDPIPEPQSILPANVINFSERQKQRDEKK